VPARAGKWRSCLLSPPLLPSFFLFFLPFARGLRTAIIRVSVLLLAVTFGEIQEKVAASLGLSRRRLVSPPLFFSLFLPFLAVPAAGGMQAWFSGYGPKTRIIERAAPYRIRFTSRVSFLFLLFSFLPLHRRCERPSRQRRRFCERSRE